MVMKGGGNCTAGPLDRQDQDAHACSQTARYGEETSNVGDPPRLEALGASCPHSTRFAFFLLSVVVAGIIAKQMNKRTVNLDSGKIFFETVTGDLATGRWGDREMGRIGRLAMPSQEPPLNVSCVKCRQGLVK